MMKEIICITILGLLLALSGCSGPKEVPTSTKVESSTETRQLTPEEIAEMEETVAWEEENLTTAPGDEEDIVEESRIWYNNDLQIEQYTDIPVEQFFYFKYYLEDYLYPYIESDIYNVNVLEGTYDNSDPDYPCFYVTVDQLPGRKIRCIWDSWNEEFRFTQSSID